MSSNSDAVPQRFIMTMDQIEKVEKLSGVKLETVCKICDFCDAELPSIHPSKKCTFTINGIECPTIYDKCYKCSLNLSKQIKTTNICHKKHDINIDKNAENQIQALVSQIANRQKKVQITMFGMSYSARCRLLAKIENGDDSDSDFERSDGEDIDITQGLLDENINIPVLKDLISRGASIHICSAGDGILLKVLM